MLRVLSQLGRPYNTIKVTTADIATEISATLLTNGGRNLCALMITVETNDVKIALGGESPVQGAGNLGHLLKKEQLPMYVVGEDACASFVHISAENGAHGKIMMTPFYTG